MSEIMPKYTFLPWLRQGIANQISQTDNLASGSATVAERASIGLKVRVKGNGTLVNTIDTDVKLIGPGDITGISPNAIIKTEPLNWITNFEPNYFPYIEFYDEDFPWRYTPASQNNHRLRPWFTLVVLKEDEFVKHVSEGAILPSIEVQGMLDQLPFPVYNETWAWTHVHVNGDLYTGNDPLIPSNSAHVNSGLDRMKEIIASNPDLVISRMICPRELDPDTDYHAFLIPSFETGRMAGLGIDAEEIATIDAQLPSWGLTTGIHNPAHSPNKWPVYHEWYFKTGAAGDFEYLVRQIIPRQLDNRVGRRPMDIRKPGYQLSHEDTYINGALMLEGALRIPGNQGEPYPWSPSDTAIAPKFRQEIASLVNLGQNILDATLADAAVSTSYYNNLGFGSNFQDDPIVAPPLYGRWHALKKTVTPSGTKWIDELNIDPRNRTIAGIGTRIIQKDQEKLMDMAWEQVGEVIEANKKLRWAQAVKEVNYAMFARHIKAQPEEEKMQLTARLHKKIRVVSGDTLYKENKDSILPVASESHAFRRIRRTNGPVMRRLDPQKEIGTQQGALHIAARMASSSPIQAADPKEIAVEATQTTVTAMQNVISYSSTLSTASYNFKMTNPGDAYSPAANNQTAIDFQSAVEIFEEHFDALNWQAEPVLPALDLGNAAAEIDIKTDPRYTLSKRVYHDQLLQFSQPVVMPAPDKIVPILAAPSFKQPMYEAVRDLSTDLLIPNLNLIPQNTISLLETNPKFIESFMVGLNHEMGRELLWREYPTDQRGTYFKHFWDAKDFVDTTGLLTEKQKEDKVADIKPIHTWLSTTQLGTHNNRSTDGGATPEANVVLVIRGDLLKKYPGAVIYAQRAAWQLKNVSGNMVHDYKKPRVLVADTEMYPIFGAKIEPDINFIGFDLNVCEVRGDEIVNPNAPHNSYDPGYFFVIRERPGEVRFGVDIAGSGSAPATWNDLRWNHVQKSHEHIILNGGTITPTDNKIPAVTGIPVSWSTNSTSADLAMATFQNPVLVAIHAKEMLNNELVSLLCP